MKKTPLLKRIRESRMAKGIALLSATELVLQMLNPLPLMALTSGPAQPEVQGFQPIGISEMVDPFTGDFSYSIPLMEIGGYPLNLSYQSGISMDQEASWAGLGWNLHTGAITRNLRGLPDDFWNDEVIERVYMKPNKTVAVNATFDLELFGFEANAITGNGGQTPGSGNLSVGLGIEYNNYTGVNLTTSMGLSLSGGSNLPMNGSLNLTSGKDGLQISPNVSYSGRIQSAKSSTSGRVNIGIGASINSRKGLTDIGLNGGVNVISGHNRTGQNKETKATESGFNGGTAGISNSSSIDLGTYSFRPSIETAMETYSFSGRFKIGGATLSQDFGGSISASGSVQRLVSNEVRVPAFGYIYSEKANDNDNALLDFNREKDNSFSSHHKYLPLTAFTQDMFSIAAQGLGGTFRPYRNDIGFVYNNRKMSPSTSGNLGLEIGLGNIVDGGVDVGLNFVQSVSGAWRDQNNAIGAIPFRSKVKNDIKEAYYLRMTGEKIPEQDMPFLNQSLKNNHALRYNLAHKTNLPRVSSKNEFTNENGTTLSGISDNQRDMRLPRNTAVYFLTVSEVCAAYPHKRKDISPHAKGHHIAEVVVVTPEGMRYVFGLAAYNTRHLERSFAAGGTRGNPGSGLATGSDANKRGLVTYDPASNSPDNTKGIDNYYSETETPAYAHSWMLTEILSPDYSDLKGDGPTQDDLGAYVRFNYGSRDTNGFRVPDIKDFGWRTPVAGAMQAGYMEGLKTNPTDDRANIVYGTKDIWYCHSIESKTHRVSFELEDRYDALGCDINGNLQTAKKQKCIKTISYESVEAGGSTPTVKKVHFKYNYSLCPGTPNSLQDATYNPARGKLTLERVFFTYENSRSGEYSPYVFSYQDKDASGNTLQYIYGENDRWGIVKRTADNPSAMSNSDFPYALQDQQKQDAYASAWSMNRIVLPSGGQVDITYESDDYAWVQDRKASNMYTIAGFSADKSGSIDNRCFSSSEQYNYLFIDVPDAGAMLSSDEFRKRYLQEESTPGDRYGPLKYLYFRFLMNVNKPNNPKYEYVSGYAEIDRTGDYCGMISSTRAYIKVKKILPAPGGSLSSPFAYAAWSFSRVNTPEYAYNQPLFDDTGFEQIIKTLASASVTKNIFEMLIGVNRRMMLEGYGSNVDVNRSWVRLFDPDAKKLGGGHRVKTIEISDNWQQMTSEPSRKYGQAFSYTLANGQSSGVAAWEPAMGADENPFKLPVYMDNPRLKLVMEERFYIEEPFGESFYPSPGVGYSRVEIKDIVYDAGVTSKSTGKTVQTFYTAKDFPVIVKSTKLEAVPKKSNPIVSLLSFNSWNFMNVSQGYSIELNDMHGKPRSQEMYAEDAGTPFAYTQHYYKTTASGTLDNHFDVLDTDGSKEQAEVGVEYDMVADFREQETESMSGNLAFNFNYGQAGAFPFFSFSLFPGFKRDHVRFRSAVVTKVIQRYGLEHRTVSFDKGALLETRTLALDKMTGNTVVQELTNEFKDKYYKTDLPAHWAYPGMAQASDNILFTFGTNGYSDVSVFNRTTGEITSAYVKSYLQPGDEVFLGKRLGVLGGTINSNAYRYWVAHDASENKLYLINYQGEKAVFSGASPANLTFTVVRSGHRNQQQQNIGSFTSMYNPVAGAALELDKDLHILSTGAVEYKEQWQTDLSFPKAETDTLIHAYYNAELIAFLNILNQSLADSVEEADDPQQLSPNVLPDYENLFDCNGNSTTFDLVARSSYTITSGVTPPWYIPPVGFNGVAPGQIFENIGVYLGNNPTLDGGMPCSCLRIFIYSLQDNTQFSFDDWNDIASFNIVTDIALNSNGYSILNAGNVGNQYIVISATMTDNTSRQFLVSSVCWPFEMITELEFIPTYSCMAQGNTVNPYIVGILGNWRAQKAWTYQGNRNNVLTASAENLRRDGYLPDYIPFWSYDGALSRWKRSTLIDNTQYENWNWTSEATLYSPYGFDLENINPLGNYSAAVYGFKNMLSVGVASNARNKEIGYDGFEDYYLDAFSYECVKPHFWVADALNKLTDSDAHSGRYSMALQADYTRTFTLTPSPGAAQSVEVPYVLDANDLLNGFSPASDYTSDKEFLLSFWAKGAYTSGTYDYPLVAADVLLDGSSVLVPGSLQKSKLAEGWQKFEYRFVIEDNAGTVPLSLVLKPGSGTVLFDDIRIHPMDANMKTYAYDRTNFRFKAELDENNFATFYQYDQEGKLVRVKKETERGVMTIQETRTHTFKR